MTTFLTLLLGAVIVAAGGVTVTRRNPIHAALSMLVALAGIAALMLGLRSPFLAAMQILLYTGAIMVLFVFVIMLLTLREEEMGPEPAAGKKMVALLAAVVLLGLLFFTLSRRDHTTFEKPWTLVEAEAQAAAQSKASGEAVSVDDLPRQGRVDYGSTEHFARFLYIDYAVPFELITVLVMAAVVGVIVMGRRPDRHSLERTPLAGGAA